MEKFLRKKSVEVERQLTHKYSGFENSQPGISHNTGDWQHEKENEHDDHDVEDTEDNPSIQGNDGLKLSNEEQNMMSSLTLPFLWYLCFMMSVTWILTKYHIVHA